MKGRHVVELGSGCGLVGLLLATLGAHVALTDLPKTMVRFAGGLPILSHLEQAH